MKYKNIFKFIFEYEQKVFILLFAVFFIGFLFGSSNVFVAGNAMDVSNMVKTSSADLFFDLILKTLVFLFIISFLGYTAVGFPFLCVLVLFSGVFLGVFSSSFIYSFGVQKSLSATLILYIPFLILVVSLIFITFSSIRLSSALFNVFKDGTRFISPKTYLVPHILKTLFYSIGSVIAVFLLAYVSVPIISRIL